MSQNLPLLMGTDTCTVCAQKKDVEVQIIVQSSTYTLCSDVCFMAFKYANNISDIGKGEERREGSMCAIFGNRLSRN